MSSQVASRLPVSGGSEGLPARAGRSLSTGRVSTQAGPAVDVSRVFSRYRIAHSIRGRLRLRPEPLRGPRDESAAREENLLLSELAGLFPEAAITVSARTGSILVLYDRTLVPAEVLFSRPDPAQKPRPKTRPSASAETGASGVDLAVINPIPGKVRSVLFYPRIVTAVLAVFRAIPYIVTAVRAIFRGRFNLDALDGAALIVCLLQRDFRSLSSITFFFALGEYLAAWTRKKSRASLSQSLALKIDHVWVREGDLERKVPYAELARGDRVVVRAGAAFPVDGTVVEGQGMVNQASMTGESLPVHRGPGASVYAGTVLEEGEVLVAATRVGGDTRIESIIRTIEESEGAKARIQGRYERMADAIVPYNFLLAGGIFALTRNLARAGSVLLVDYSCAIRLATPLSIVTAMREAADRGALIKGGKYMEALAEADVVVFDKTGTLTEARPRLVDVVPFGSMTRTEALRLAACLEEHFAHPVGQAVVRASDAEGLKHREEHAKVEYIVAHGIASTWEGQRVLIGSSHFVLEDEGIRLTAEQESLVGLEADKGRSILYLSVGGELAAVLLIEDTIRANTASVIRALRDDGVGRIIMLTGDGPKTAASIARTAGITEYRAQMLPEEKAAFVRDLQAEGCKVAMIGDGINDSPALSAADVGIAMAEGADIAREVADIVLVNGELRDLLMAREISREALRRIRKGFRASVVLNSMFLAGGLAGLIRPGLSAFLHNASTAAIAVSTVQPILPEPIDQPGTESEHDRQLH